MESNTAAQFLQNILSHLRTGPGGDSFQLDVPPGALVQMDPSVLNNPHRRGHISAAIRVERAGRPVDPRRDERDFNPLGTIQRWSEEAKILHGKFAPERLAKMTDHVILRLLPAAIQAEKEAKEAEEQELAKRTEAESKTELESKVEAEAETVEEVQERYIEDAQSASAQEPLSQAGTSDPLVVSAPDTDADMVDAPPTQSPMPPNEDQPTTSASTQAVEAESEVPTEQAETSAERVTIFIHGSPVDITDTGIDPTFLEALPDDMREEVINQHVRDQRAARVERPADSQISSEFLDALPPDIRAEILQQERAEQARRRVEDANQAGNAVAPAEIDNADFIASLDPQLREVVLLDQDDGFIRTLPSHMIAEAQGYREGSHRHHRHRTNIPPARGPTTITRPLYVPRDAIQLLEKSGIAILVRLLFFPQVLKKNILLKVLLHICENSKTRTELFNVLLSILQDGSGDLAAMDKSFAHMSFRNTKPHSQSSKLSNKQKTVSEYPSGLSLPNDIVPELRARRCLEALTFIVSSNELSSLFFLTEHELPIGLRKVASKKGKGKEKQSSPTHYPIVLLLSLLERESLLKTSSIMESVVGLLASVTRPLTSLRNPKQDSEAQASTSTAQAADAVLSFSSPTAMTTDESPANVLGRYYASSF
jgi:E3 ubiquitin-protein ligase HUWE1